MDLSRYWPLLVVTILTVAAIATAWYAFAKDTPKHSQAQKKPLGDPEHTKWWW